MRQGRSLRTQFTVYIAASGFGMWLLFMGLHIGMQRSHLDKLKDDNAVWLRNLSKSFLFDIQIGSTRRISHALEELVRTSYFDSIELEFTGSKQHLSFGRTKASDHPGYLGRLAGSSVLRLTLSDSNGTEWATLKASIHPSRYYQPWETETWRAAILGLATCLIGSAISILLSNRLQRPFARTVEAIQGIGTPSSARSPSTGVLELDGLVTTFKDTTRRLSHLQRQTSELEVLAAMGRLTSTLAHDVRGPLTSTRYFVQNHLFRHEPEVCDQIIQSIDSILNMIEGMMQSLRSTDKKPVPTDLSSALKTAQIYAFTSRARSNGIRWDWEFGHSSPVFADPSLLTRAFTNLFQNAVEAILEIGKSAAGSIHVRTKENRGTIEIEIWNSGPPIPSDVLERLTKVGCTFGKTRGTGLGLLSVASGLESIGGGLRISNDSTERGGVVYWIELRKVLVTPTHADRSKSGKRRVAIVDDSNLTQLAWTSSNIDHQVDAYSSPEDFDRRTGTSGEPSAAYDLIISDYDFGAGSAENGIQFVKRLKESGLQGKFVLSSANSDFESSELRTELSPIFDLIVPKGVYTLGEIEERLTRE